MTALFVSAHLDDAALSCAASLLRARARGERVIVATVFTEGKGSRARRQEDRRALEAFGIEAIHLGALDAPERLGVAPSFSSLLLEPRVDRALVARIAARLHRLIAELRPRAVHLPLGIGGHIDHRTVFACRRALRARAAPGFALRFYEDRPYAFVPALRALRLLELRGGAGAPRLAERLGAQLARVPLLDSFASEEERASCLRALEKRLSSARAPSLALRSAILRAAPAQSAARLAIPALREADRPWA